jgi:transposase
MEGKNWNSKTRTYTNIKNQDTLNKAKAAQQLKIKGLSVEEIASKLNLSKSRIYEYLRK